MLAVAEAAGTRTPEASGKEARGRLSFTLGPFELHKFLLLFLEKKKKMHFLLNLLV